MKYSILLSSLLICWSIFAQVPHTFSPGDPVSSSKINENFQYATKRLYLLNDGVKIGHIFTTTQDPLTDKVYHVVVTNKGYFYHSLILNYLKQPSISSHYHIEFSEASCQGNAYVNIDHYSEVNTIFTSGNKIFFRDKSVSPVNVTTKSARYYNTGSCSTFSNDRDGTKWPLTANDESVTGFPSTIGTLSISYE